MRRRSFALVILATTQIIGWGTVGVLPVIASRVAADFGVALPATFLGTSVMYVAMALAAPAAGRAFHRFGTRDVMAAGAGLIGLGLSVLGLSPNLLVFWAAWALIGVGGAMFLTTSAYAYIAAVFEDRARGLIGTLMLVTGLAGSLFWPMTACLADVIGWRGAVLAYAGIVGLVVCPLVHFGLPPTEGSIAAPARQGAARKGRVFVLLVAAIALNSFATFGVEAVGIELLQGMGMDLAKAVAIASVLGFFKVGGRIVDLAGGQRWDGLSTALVSAAMIPAGLAAIWIGGAGPLAIGGYLVLFGVGSGAFAVARATMPLVFYSKAEYATAMATIALPMNLINALAPPVLAALMAGIGARAVFAVLGSLSVAALALLLQLNGLRVRLPFDASGRPRTNEASPDANASSTAS